MHRDFLIVCGCVAAVAQPLRAQSLYERPVAAAPARSGSAPKQAPSAMPRSTDADEPMPMQTPEGTVTGSGEVVPGSGQAAANASAVIPGTAGTPIRSFGRRASRAPTLADISLYAVEAPSAREFAENDLVTIIISERSKTERNQKLDSKKDYSIDAGVQAWIDLLQLLEARATPDGKTSAQLPSVGVDFQSDFKGDGKYNREDKLTDRIQARVVEVKPNGTLLIEARRSIKTDEEVQEVVLSGLCRGEDITDANTIQSNQLYDLALNVQNKGEVKKAGEKGLIPRVLDTLFNF